MERNTNGNWLTSMVCPTNRNQILIIGGLVFLLFCFLMVTLATSAGGMD